MIFYAEDDTNIRELVLYTLQKSGFAARGFADGAALMQAMRAELPDLVLLDVMLPGEDGVSLLRRLRADGRTRELRLPDGGAAELLFALWAALPAERRVAAYACALRVPDGAPLEERIVNAMEERTVSASGERCAGAEKGGAPL